MNDDDCPNFDGWFVPYIDTGKGHIIGVKLAHFFGRCHRMIHCTVISFKDSGIPLKPPSEDSNIPPNFCYDNILCVTLLVCV